MPAPPAPLFWQGLHKLNLSGTKFRQMLRNGDDIPEWFAFKSVVKVGGPSVGRREGPGGSSAEAF